MGDSRAEEQLADQLREAGIPFDREVKAIPGRQFKVDFVIPVYMIAIEVEGFAARGQPGRHQRASGFNKDIVKYNLLAMYGYTLLRYNSRMIRYKMAIRQIMTLIFGEEKVEEVYGKEKVIRHRKPKRDRPVHKESPAERGDIPDV